MTNSTTQLPEIEIPPANDFGMAYAYGLVNGFTLGLENSLRNGRSDKCVREEAERLIRYVRAVEVAVTRWQDARRNNPA